MVEIQVSRPEHPPILIVGIGVQYNPSESIGIRFGLDRYEAAVKQASATQNYNSNVIAASFVYRF